MELLTEVLLSGVTIVRGIVGVISFSSMAGFCHCSWMKSSDTISWQEVKQKLSLHTKRWFLLHRKWVLKFKEMTSREIINGLGRTHFTSDQFSYAPKCAHGTLN